jgi:hypothetical protein
VLLGREYGIEAAPVYANSQAGAASLAKTLEGYHYRILGYAQHLRSYPLSALREIFLTAARMAVYRAAGLMNADKRLIEMRWNELTPEARRAYDDAKAQVLRRLAGRGA